MSEYNASPAPADDVPVISKSEAKRRMHALQQLAADIASLPVRERQEIELPDGWHDEIELLARMKPSGARNRQLRHFAKRLEDAPDACTILRDRVEAMRSGQIAASGTHRRIEQWRDRLLAEGDPAVDSLVGVAPTLERHALRSLLAKIQRSDATQRAILQRQLFRLLRDHLDAPSAD